MKVDVPFSPAAMDQVTAEATREAIRRIELRDEIAPPRILEARRSLIGFTRLTFPGYIGEPAHELIAGVMDRVISDEERRVMIFAPPQMGKSQLTSIQFPAYWLGRRPDDPVILVSHGANLAYTFSRRARELVRSLEYQQIFPQTNMSGLSTAVDLWEIGGRRGYLAASGVGGPILGMGALLGIIDDPVKNYQEAHSPTYREHVWEWYRTTFLGRLWEHAAILLIMSRWDVHDLAGRILKAEPGEWLVLRLPALAEPQKERDQKNDLLGLPKGLPDLLGRKPGEPVTPIRFSKKAAVDRRKKVGPSAWESEYQGSPVEAEGNMVKRSSFISRMSAPANLRRVRYWDKAATAGGGTWTVGILMGKDDGKDAEFTHYIEHMVRGQWGTRERDRTIKQTAAADNEKYGHVAVRFEVEGGSSGKDVEGDTIRMLEGYDVKGDSPTGSKEVRAIPFARQVEAGNVAIIAGEWNQDYLDNIVLFPNGGKDEMDASSGAFNSLLVVKKIARARARGLVRSRR